MSESSVPTKCFISYHRPDNADYTDVVDRLKSEIAARYAAETGRALDIFLDRESIGWGEDWRTKIRGSVLEATVFLPVITMRYFQSDACAEELNMFHENAQQLGVTELILPIVLAGSTQISADHENSLVRLIDALNYKRIDRAWRAGYDSHEWLQVVDDMVHALIDSLARAEAALADREQADEAEDDDGESPAADIAELQEAIEGMTVDMQAALAEMTALGTEVSGVSQAAPPSASASQKQAALIRASRTISDSGARFADAAGAFERRATATDVSLRAVILELREIDNDTAREALHTLRESIGDMPDLAGQLASIDGAVSEVRVAAMSSVSMRKALSPTLRALASMRSGLETVQSWAAI
jgi:hypothetical protein